MVLLILLALTSGVAILLSLIVVGLLEAPWPVLLSLLFVGLLGLQRLAVHATAGDDGVESPMAQSSSAPQATAPPEPPADDGPTYTYRGVKYRSHAPAQPKSDDSSDITGGIYRGHPWQRANSDASPEPSSSEPPTELKYRGHRVNK